MRGTLTKTISIVLIAMLLTTGMAFAAVPSDVTGQPYEKAVDKLMELNAITGDTDGLFHPDNTLTRAQACCIIVKTIDPPTSELNGTPTLSVPDSGFTDLTGYKNWAGPYINYAAQNNITKGVSATKFAPGSPVTVGEIVTFVLRAAGYDDKQLTGVWPNNYMDKAKESGLFDGMGLVNQEGELISPETPATKWMAAWLTYNGLEMIQKAHSGETTTPATDVPSKTGMKFANSKFDLNCTTYDGVSIDKNAVVYTYDVEKNYKSGMTLSDQKGDYRLDTVYKFRNCSTPAWYKVENGKITQMVLPEDGGFSGKAYGVINGKMSVVNAEDEKVLAFETLVAGKEITWLGKEGLTDPGTIAYGGELYELTLSNGYVKSVVKITTGQEAVQGKYVKVLTSGGWDTIFEKSDGVYRLTDANGNLIEVKDNAVVYQLDKNGKEYTVSKQSALRKDAQIRCYDVTDDDENMADVVIVKAR